MINVEDEILPRRILVKEDKKGNITEIREELLYNNQCVTRFKYKRNGVIEQSSKIIKRKWIL